MLLNKVILIDDYDYIFVRVLDDYQLLIHTEIGRVCGQIPFETKHKELARLAEIWKEYNLSTINDGLLIELQLLIEDIELIEIEAYRFADDYWYSNKYLSDMYPILENSKVIALAKHLDLSPEEASKIIDNYGSYEYEREEYKVLTDDEANAEAYEYVEDTYKMDLGEVVEYMRKYIDYDLYMRENYENIDRGEILSCVNGQEYKSYGYYIYQIN